MKFIKQIILFFFLFSVFCPIKFVYAQGVDTGVSMANPMCWTKEACENKRKQLLGANPGSYEGGWVQEDPCTGDWGKCLPVGVTKAQISFGGDQEFSEAGSYIRAVYNYGIAAIGIVAVVVIIIAGAQWITSAGNAEVIGRAKKRISGAIIGLFIAYMSYAILQTINPATVSLRLPQVWLIAPVEERGVEVAEGDYCDPTGGPTKSECESGGDKICFTIGYDKDREGPCAKAAYWISVGSVSMLGAAAGVGGALGNAGSRIVSSGGNAISKFVTKIPAKELLNYSKSEIAKSTLKNVGSKVISLNGLKWGATAVGAGVVCSKISEAAADSVSCGQIAISTAEGVVNLAIEEFDDFFANHNGVCLPKAEALKNGEMCKIGSSQCAEGKCVMLEGVTAIFKCWANTEIGFCSDGKNKAMCASDADCQSGLKCILDQYVPSCSDGSNDSPCAVDADCAPGLTCSLRAYGGLGRCVGSTVGIGNMCKTNFECAEGVSSCYAVKNESCQFSALVTDESSSASWGLMNLNSGNVMRGYGICARNPSASEIGPYMGDYMFYYHGTACGWTGTSLKSYILCQDDSVCGGKTCTFGGTDLGICI